MFRWLRGAGIDVHAVVQTAVHEKLGGMDRARDIDEELADLGATGSLVHSLKFSKKNIKINFDICFPM